LTEAFIGLGSNVGDRLGYLTRAIEELHALGPVRMSSIHETEPVGPPQPRFLNAVAALETTLSARELFDALKRIEASLGRVARERWGPREIDLDLLLYGDEEIDEPDLKVPHPEMANRPFVLIPLAELRGIVP
jgi:2-amino-4-hydroxy-6-hydroxymethyldihydropteridine diphosphokinase